MILTTKNGINTIHHLRVKVNQIGQNVEVNEIKIENETLCFNFIEIYLF